MPAKLRLRLLIAIHLVLTAASPLVVLFQSTSIWSLPLIWGATSVVFGQLMLLAFWAGLGTSGRAWRITGTVLGTGYAAFWVTSPRLLLLWGPKPSWMDWPRHFAVMFGQYGLFVLILGIAFLIMRRWFSHLDCVADVQQPVQTFQYQFSIQQLLMITTMSATFLASWRGKNEAMDYRLMIITSVLIVAVFVVNALYAVRGTLRQGPIRGQMFFVFVVAILHGVGLSLIGSIHHLSGWLAALFALTMTVPTLVIVLSLLVVRSCGYRLVPNPPTQIPGVLNVSDGPS